MFRLLESPIKAVPYFWLIESGPMKVGIDSKNQWWLNIHGKTTGLSRPEDSTPLLPLLEIGRADFHNFLQRICTKYLEMSKMESSFPEVLLLQNALRSVSDYWPAKALDWIDQQPALKNQLMEDLINASNNKRFSQSLRSRITKLTRSIGQK